MSSMKMKTILGEAPNTARPCKNTNATASVLINLIRFAESYIRKGVTIPDFLTAAAHCKERDAADKAKRGG